MSPLLTVGGGPHFPAESKNNFDLLQDQRKTQVKNKANKNMTYYVISRFVISIDRNDSLGTTKLKFL